MTRGTTQIGQQTDPLVPTMRNALIGCRDNARLGGMSYYSKRFTHPAREGTSTGVSRIGVSVHAPVSLTAFTCLLSSFTAINGWKD